MSNGGSEPRPDAPSPPGGAAKIQPWVWFAGFVLVMILLISGGFLIPRAQRQKLGGELTALKADEVPAHPKLYAYAVEMGEPVYAKHCATCHGDDLEGDPTRGVPRLNDAAWLYGRGRMGDIETTILYGVRSGHPMARNPPPLPAFAPDGRGRFCPAWVDALGQLRVRAVAAYIKSRSQESRSAAQIRTGSR